MKALITALCIASIASFATGAVAADDQKKQPTAQQAKMGTCNKEAGEKKLKGDERKKFMSECLKGGAADTAKATDSNCEAKAVSKDGKKLTGAAKEASIKRCEADAAAGTGAAAAGAK